MDDQAKEEAFHHKGDRLGKFLILAELGRGSMGVVYKAFQEGINREVALKILPANITLDEKAVKRFHREAESVGRLSHSNIIQIYDNGTIEGTHYFAMEMVDGKDFSEVRCRNRDDILEAARLVRDAAEALAHAHAEGVIHRDIKPSNIMLDKSGRVLVTDFGLARIKDSASLTSTDAVVGTPKYMSPEQVLPGSHPIDGRVDVYSLGATLYECITGQPPLDAPSIQAFFKAIIEERPSSPRRLNKQCPHDLATIVLRCLEKNPNDRYPNAKGLAEDLDRFLKGERIQARPKGAVALGIEWVRRHKVISGLSVIALITLLATVFLSGEVRKQTDELALQRELTTIRTEPDLGVAAVAAQELAKRHPEHPEVGRLLSEINTRLADQALNEKEPNWQLVQNYMERAGKTGDLWYLMAMLELDERDKARAAVAKLDAETESAFLTRARLDLFDGKPARALGRLTGHGGELHPFSLLVTAQARRALAAGEQDSGQARAHLEQARQLLRDARAEVRVRWLRSQIEYELWEVGRRLGEQVSLRDTVGDISVIANRWWSKATGVWEGMTAKQAGNLKIFIGRVLEFGGVPPQTIAAEIEAKANERLKKDDPREKLIAYLMLGVAQLSNRALDEARDAFDAAGDQIEMEDPLEPYVYWGKSLVQRARGDLSQAVMNAQQALQVAVLDQDTFKDMEALARHTAALAEDAGKAKQGQDRLRATRTLKEELGKLKSPGAWVAELLSRLRR